MPIHDVSKPKSGALTIGGKLEGGAVKVGNKVMLIPSGEVGTVKALEVNGQVGDTMGGLLHCLLSDCLL